jgi:hypothetical protein
VIEVSALSLAVIAVRSIGFIARQRGQVSDCPSASSAICSRA